MGHMTTLTILNDEYHQLEKNPKMLFDAIDDAMHGGKGGRKGIKSTNGYYKD